MEILLSALFFFQVLDGGESYKNQDRKRKKNELC